MTRPEPERHQGGEGSAAPADCQEVRGTGRRAFLRTLLTCTTTAAIWWLEASEVVARDGAEGELAAPPRPWRPFSEFSPFNTPIPADPALHPQSAAMVRTLGTSGGLLVNIRGFSIPVFPVPPRGAEMREVVCDRKAYSGSASVRCPVWFGLQPDPQSDAHLVIVDRQAGKEWDFWGARWEKGELRTKAASEVRLDGDGLTPLGGCRLVGFALLAGLIRPEEIEAGEINHALVFAHDYVGPAVWPAVRGGGPGRKPLAPGEVPVPAGGCVQLDPELDVDSLRIPLAGRIIAKALQKYGMYNSDFAGGLVTYAENPLGRFGDPWPGLGLDGRSTAGIPLERLRVVAPEVIKEAVEKKKAAALRKAAEGG